MAAVEVMRSCLTSWMHWRYVGSETQLLAASQTQVPPESDTMEALTEILEKLIEW